MLASNSAAQVSTVLYTGRMPSEWRRRRTSSSDRPRSWPTCSSLKPICLASNSSPWFKDEAPAMRSAISFIWAI